MKRFFFATMAAATVALSVAGPALADVTSNPNGHPSHPIQPVDPNNGGTPGTSPGACNANATDNGTDHCVPTP